MWLMKVLSSQAKRLEKSNSMQNNIHHRTRGTQLTVHPPVNFVSIRKDRVAVGHVHILYNVMSNFRYLMIRESCVFPSFLT